eukprot:CAMPEP_0177653100 /NCGR_PEP_ID=MMETSP0447-20121125/13528_1 /TAXON_ID=0 /ORGANISM="Stygamoeba regulata, Strain BSH-02190019" /LENGTH=135 /DNA_ID=CAMNT_0019156479 /DNA_START=116 /DNA_END=523 /DNA_ORIENTATION=+
MSSTSSVKNADLDSLLQNLISRIDGLHVVLLTDIDGVVLCTATDAASADYVFEDELAAAAAFASVSEHAGKLGSGKNRSITRYSKRGVTVHMNYSPLVLSLIGDDNMNCGVANSFYDQLDHILKPFQRVVAEADE